MDADEENELRDLLAERDRYIDELEVELSAQEQENDRYRDDLLKCQDKIAELEAEAKQLRLDNKDLVDENVELEEQASAQKSELDAQSSRIAAAAKSSEDAKRLQRDGNQQLQRLELENQRLRAMVLELEENEDILVNEIDTLVKENSEYKEQTEELSSKCDSLYADIDEKARENLQLTQEKEKAQNDLEAEKISYSKDSEELVRRDATSRSEITRLLTELEQERTKHKDLTHVKENEAFRKELAKVRRENQRLLRGKDQCLGDKNQAERDLDSAIQALNETKRNAREEIASVARKERMSSKEANSKLDAAHQKENALRMRCLDAEEQLEDLRKQLERSEERNSSYEKNHGLTEAIRCQKQLEADIRRRDYDLKRLNHALGVEMDKRRALHKACDWLKEKANLGPEFSFSDGEIRTALLRDDSRLSAENEELSRQIEALEGERTKLLSQLRERAIEIADKGVRFLGMSSSQISQVMEFASNLRNGTAELPLDDRSKELLSEVSNLKSDRDVDRVTIERLEREIFSLSEATNEEPRGEGLVLKRALDEMTGENRKLRDEIDALKAGESNNQNRGSALTLAMRQRANKLLGEDLVDMPAAAEAQFLCLMNEYGKMTEELTLLKNNTPKESSGDKVHANSSANGVLDSSLNNVDATALRDSQTEHFRQCTYVVNERNEKLTDIVSNMKRAMEEMKNERDLLSAQLSQLGNGDGAGQRNGLISEVTNLTIKCDSLEEDLKKEKLSRINAQRVLAEIRVNHKNSIQSTANVAVREMENAPEHLGIHRCEHGAAARDEAENMNESLQQTQIMLSGYIDSMAKVRSSIFAMQENRVDSARICLQISCLNDIIREKNRVIKETKQKLAAAKQMSIELYSRNKGFHEEKKSDRSISTNSIDRSILRAASNSGHNTPTRNRLENATKLVFEKESVILDQNRTILELEEKLATTDAANQHLSKEAERMKTDISTLVSRLAESESEVNAIEAYQKKFDQVQNLLENNKKEASSLKEKLSALSKERAEKDAKIKALQDSVSRAKRMLTVARQGRARSEKSVKASEEEASSLKDQLEKMAAALAAAKKEKIDAQNEKLKLSRKARLSALKLKETNEKQEKAKTREELEKRVSVLNKTVSGLASQNSKLRGELAAQKLLKKKADEEAAATIAQPIGRRESISRERPTSSRAKSLEEQVKSLQKSLSQEKRHAADSSSMLDRYQKRIGALEQALQSTTRQNNGDELKNGSTFDRVGSDSDVLQRQILSLTNENKSLKQRINETRNNGNMESLVKELKFENDVLKKENERLSQVDHLDFFEEIEDLKYKYNEAVRQINELTTG